MKKFLFLLLLLMLPLLAQATPVILVYGDSLSSGYGLPSGSDWVSLLRERLASQSYNYTVVNASVAGETTLGGRNRIEQTLKDHPSARIVILELGGNDGLRGTAIAAIRANLTAIIAACLKAKVRVLLAGMELPPNYGSTYTRQFHQVYTELAARYRLAFVPFLLEGFGERPEYFQADGIHPAQNAQPLILENIWKALRPLLSAGKKR